MQRLLVISDAWGGQINGVVTTLTRTLENLEARGIQAEVVGPNEFRSVPMPGYAEIHLAIAPYRRLSRRIKTFEPDAVHISTEGPLGWAARRYCLRHNLPFTTSFHTRFPDYVSARVPIPARWVWSILRKFHAPSMGVMTATQSLENELRERGFQRLVRWSRGVDLSQFHPRFERYSAKPPVLLYLGRVAQEKNVQAFLDLKEQIQGRYVVVGDGPMRADLQARYPEVEWRGYQTGKGLSESLAEADCMVFPSRTDTFGLVMIEAMACGTPVAAYPEQGPLEVVQSGVSGGVNEDLTAAVKLALQCDRTQVRARAERFTWERATDQFLSNIQRVSSNRHLGVTVTS